MSHWLCRGFIDSVLLAPATSTGKFSHNKLSRNWLFGFWTAVLRSLPCQLVAVSWETIRFLQLAQCWTRGLLGGRVSHAWRKASHACHKQLEQRRTPTHINSMNTGGDMKHPVSISRQWIGFWSIALWRFVWSFQWLRWTSSVSWWKGKIFFEDSLASQNYRFFFFYTWKWSWSFCNSQVNLTRPILPYDYVTMRLFVCDINVRER